MIHYFDVVANLFANIFTEAFHFLFEVYMEEISCNCLQICMALKVDPNVCQTWIEEPKQKRYQITK